MPTSYDIAIIGGGIVGLATAHAITTRYSARLIVLEAEPQLAAHQTGHNSGVIHSGLYYKPGSLKALNCTAGREAMYRFCQEHGLPHDRCGKIVVATQDWELPILDRIEERGRMNGLLGVKRLRAEELREYEPHVAGLAGLLVPETGIVDYKQVCGKYAEMVRQNNGDVLTGSRVIGFRSGNPDMILETTAGPISCRYLINCCGLQSDRIARLCGLEPGVRIIPFRGEYYELIPTRQGLVKNLIYPVPDPRFPFLGVHFTRMIHGGVEAGPNAVLAFKREGYHKFSFSAGDTWEILTYGGFWRLILPVWQAGMGEFYRSFSKRAFVRALQRLIPDLREADVHPAGAGVRAQAVDSQGHLVDDFSFAEAERQIHILNAPSPAATASLSIGGHIADLAEKRFGLKKR